MGGLGRGRGGGGGGQVVTAVISKFIFGQKYSRQELHPINLQEVAVLYLANRSESRA